MKQAYDHLLDQPLPEVDADQLCEGLLRILPEAALLRSREQMKPFECDGLVSYRNMPLAVVLPETVDQVRQVLKLCHALAVPIVTRGAGTGLSGGALPCANGILLVLSRLNQILEIDPEQRCARVQPGVSNLSVSVAAKPYGLYYAPDPSSQIACSIGGNVAENAGGVHCLKYGLTIHNVLKLTVLTAEGELLEVGGVGADSAGLDVLALLIGSEGMLGVVVEITVKLLVKPPCVSTLLTAFDSVQVAGLAVADIIAAGVVPAGLEMMDKLALTAAEDFAHAGYPRDAAAILLVELDGYATEVEAEVDKVRQVLASGGATEVRLAQDDDQRALFWKGRKSAFPAVGRLSPDYYCMDGTIPRHTIGAVLTYIGELSAAYKLPVANVFHAGDGNLHPLIMFDANIAGEFERVEEMGGKILEKCIAVGGTITGEHGVGREKINQMAAQFSDVEITQFQKLKNALDPRAVLNPGKNIPTLKRCQEYRAITQRLSAAKS
ncbi:MAG: FAD-linked oxidase C-terminal domain-containing protein [Pseudomonadales bacterium]